MDDTFKTCIPFLVASVCCQIKKGWVEEHFPDQHPLFLSTFWQHRHYLPLIADGMIMMSTLDCKCCGMRASGVPAHTRMTFDFEVLSQNVRLLIGEQHEMRDTLREVIGSANGSPLSDVVVSRISTLLSDETAAMRNLIEAKLSSLTEEVLSAVSDGADFGRRRVADAGERLDMAVEEPEAAAADDLTFEVDDVDAWTPERHDEVEVQMLQRSLCRHMWAVDGEDQLRFHPCADPFNFPSSEVTVGSLFVLWHKTSERAELPPFKVFSICDIRSDKVKAFIKAKSVCDHIFAIAKEGGKLPAGRALGTQTRAQLDGICAYAVDTIARNHDKWLREQSLKPPKRRKNGQLIHRKPYKPFKPRKATSLSYLTLHNYLHRRDSHLFDDESVNDVDSD